MSEFYSQISSSWNPPPIITHEINKLLQQILKALYIQTITPKIYRINFENSDIF